VVGRGGGPLLAETQHHGVAAVGEEQRRDRPALVAALKVASGAGRFALDVEHDVAAAGAARPLAQPAVSVRGTGQGRFGMWNAAVPAQRGKAHRVFQQRDRRGVIAGHAPMRCHSGDELRPILEARSIDDGDRVPIRRQRPQGGEQLLGIDREAGGPEADMRRRGRKGVLIAEAIGHQRQIAGAARRHRQRAARYGGDQDGCGVTH
jgi:hypothetical protein